MPGAIVNASLAARELFAAEKRGEEEERERERGRRGRAAGNFFAASRQLFFPILSVSLFIPFSLRRWRKKEGDEKKDSGFWILNLGERDIYIYIYSRRRGYCLVTAVRL